MQPGPILIGFDGSAVAEWALREGGALFAPRRALVVVVWEAGLALETLELPTATVGMPAVPIDIAAGLQVEDAMQEAAQRIARWGVELAREAGLEAEGLAVADERSVAETLVRVAEERAAQAIVVGTHGPGGVGRLLMGSTAEGVIRRARCPVTVARPAA